jgi:glycosyltransferase involved in cell wall biosynthesis
MKEISVVVTTYMHGKYIRATIESVLAQTFKDYELIIIDDESPDNTEKEVSKLKDKRIQYIRQNHSGLPAHSRNRGIKAASGRFIALLDGDDIWFPEKLDRCYEIFRQHPEVDLVCHNEVMRKASGKIIKVQFYGPYVPQMFRRLLFRGNCLSPSATVIRKKALLDEGLLFREDPDFFMAEDYDLWLRFSKRHIFHFIPEPLGEFLLHETNASANFEKHYINQIEVIKNNFQNYKEKKTFDFCLVNLRIARAYFVLVRNFAREKKIKEVSKYLFKTMLQFFASA